MAAKYVLKLAGKEEKATILGAEVNLREVDLNILENLFYAAANTHKQSSEIHICMDFVDQVKNIGDASEIILDTSDKKNLEIGISATAEKRPVGWFSSNLWKQFDVLTPVKE